MKNLFFAALIGSLCLFGCEKSEKVEIQNEIDRYGVELGTIENYDGTGCTVSIKKQATTRSSYIDEIYEVEVEKPGKEPLDFIVTLEEIPGEGKVVATQFDEDWNEMVAIVYEDKEISDIVVNDELPPMTTESLRSWWRCTAEKYRIRKDLLYADAGSGLACDLSDVLFVGACTVGTFLRSATNCL